jgi:hypothetical protein
VSVAVGWKGPTAKCSVSAAVAPFAPAMVNVSVIAPNELAGWQGHGLIAVRPLDPWLRHGSLGSISRLSPSG